MSLSHFRSFDENYAEDFLQAQNHQFPNGLLHENGECHPDKFEAMADALAWMLAYCWLKPHGQTREPRAAFKRFVAVSMTMRGDLFDGGSMTFAQMARKLRFTKAALSKLSVEFSDKAGLKFRRNRRKRAAMSRLRVLSVANHSSLKS